MLQNLDHLPLSVSLSEAAHHCQKGHGKHRGLHYRGHVSKTKSGHPCQKWTAQHPHKHDRTPAKYAGKGKALSRQLFTFLFLNNQLFANTSLVWYYVALKIQKLAFITLISSGLGNHNHCRNADESPNANGVWCYTMNPKVRWEICAVPSCG